jgi:aspartate aminotransferase/aminotransferase
MTTHPWLADRTAKFDSSGIRKVFDLAAKMASPINLSIGQPDFAVPDAVKEAAIAAIRGNKNGYSVTQGIPELLARLQRQIDEHFGHADRRVLVTSGTSGGLVLAVMAMVNPGDEVIVFDPYFVMYPSLVAMAGGRCVVIDTYPDFRIDPDRVAAAITPRTKMILLNSPANPTGVVASGAEVRALAELAARHNIALVSDEIYREFCLGTIKRSSSTGLARRSASPVGVWALCMDRRRSSTSSPCCSSTRLCALRIHFNGRRWRRSTST